MAEPAQSAARSQSMQEQTLRLGMAVITPQFLQTGALTLSSTSNFRVDINGTTAGTGYDQIQVNDRSGVTITGSNLVVTVGTTLSVGQTFTILNKVSAGAITGTFAGIPQGGTVVGSNGTVFSVSYTGGDGNDIVLTVVSRHQSKYLCHARSPASMPMGVAAEPAHLLVSRYFATKIMTVDCKGNVSLFGTIPAPSPPILTEKYMAMAPSQSAAAGFTPRDVFVTQGAEVFKATPPGPFTLFAIGPGRGATFRPQRDYVRPCGHIWLQHDRNVRERRRLYRLTGLELSRPSRTRAPTIEGPAVAPLIFGPFGGQILAADEFINQVHAIKNDGTVTLNILLTLTRKASRYPVGSVHLLLPRAGKRLVSPPGEGCRPSRRCMEPPTG